LGKSASECQVAHPLHSGNRIANSHMTTILCFFSPPSSPLQRIGEALRFVQRSNRRKPAIGNAFTKEVDTRADDAFKRLQGHESAYDRPAR